MILQKMSKNPPVANPLIICNTILHETCPQLPTDLSPYTPLLNYYITYTSSDHGYMEFKIKSMFICMEFSCVSLVVMPVDSTKNTLSYKKVTSINLTESTWKVVMDSLLFDKEYTCDDQIIKLITKSDNEFYNWSCLNRVT